MTIRNRSSDDTAPDPADEERALCPECGAELDADGICPECGDVEDDARATEDEDLEEGSPEEEATETEEEEAVEEEEELEGDLPDDGDRADDATGEDAGDEEESAGEDDERAAPATARGEPRVLHRRLTLRVDRERLATRAEGDSRIPVCFSSEAPVLRYDYWEGERYYEVLDHSPSSVDLSYARDGLPFILEHYTGDLVGRVFDVTVDQDRRCRGMLQLSQSQRGREIGQDILDGLRPTISFGYRTGDSYTQTGGEEEGTIPTRRYTQWQPMEVSSVAIPADASVGIGRSARIPARVRQQHPTDRPHRPGSSTVRDNTTAARNGAAPNRGAGAPRAGAEPRQRSVEEFRRIEEMCRSANCTQAETDRFLNSNASVREIAADLFERAAARAQSLLDGDRSQSEELGISRGEQREYSLGRALIALVNNRWEHAGYEREVNQQLARSLGRSSNGILVPLHLPLSGIRTPLTAGVAAQGGNIVPSQMATTLIELLRNKSVIERMNPLRMPGLQGNIPLPRQTGAGTAAWRTENPGADTAESNMTFDDVTLSPKNILAMESYSKQLFAQSVFSVDTLIRDDLTTILALLYDFHGLHGDGAGNNITGIYNQTGVNAVAMGGAITFGKVVDMESAIEAANADGSRMGYVTTPEIKGKAKQTQVLSNTAGIALWTGSVDAGEMNGYRALASNQVAKNLGVGTNEHGIVFGDFSQAIVADWGAIDITVDPYTKAGQAQVRIIAHWLVDFQLRHGPAFSKGTGLTNT